MPWDIRGRDQLEQALQNAGLAIIAVENVAEAQELAVAVRGSDDKARLRAELEALVNEADESEFARLAAAVTASPDDGLDERVIVYVSACRVGGRRRNFLPVGSLWTRRGACWRPRDEPARTVVRRAIERTGAELLDRSNASHDGFAFRGEPAAQSDRAAHHAGCRCGLRPAQ